VVESGRAPVSALHVAPPSDDVLAALLRAGADHPLREDAPYCAAVSRPSQPHRVVIDAWTVEVEHDGLRWLLAEGPDAHLLDRAFPADVCAGIGLPRRGASGAARSVEDARQAYALAAAAGGPVSFGEEWVAATLLAHGDGLGPLCAPAVEVARRYPYLSDAVRAFAERGLSVVGAARSLHVHPNTVIYRLERWHRLTGWDARTFTGLSRSMAALAVGQTQSTRQPERVEQAAP
jgi:hypothetical protein